MASIRTRIEHVYDVEPDGDKMPQSEIDRCLAAFQEMVKQHAGGSPVEGSLVVTLTTERMLLFGGWGRVPVLKIAVELEPRRG